MSQDKADTRNDIEKMLDTAADPKKPSAPLVAKALRHLSRQVAAVNRNEFNLMDNDKILAKRLKRVEDMLFDSIDKENGSVQGGLASQFRKMVQEMGQLQAESSFVALMATSTKIYLTREFPKLIARDAAEAEYEAAMDAVIEEVSAKGERAIEQRQKANSVVESCERCSFCVHWKSTTLLLVGGDDMPDKCTMPMVQLHCPSCLAMHPEPVDPMAVGDAKCGQCQTKLSREIERNGGTRTMCAMLTPEAGKVAKALADGGIDDDFATVVMRDIGCAEPLVGAPGEIGVAEVPSGPTRPAAQP